MNTQGLRDQPSFSMAASSLLCMLFCLYLGERKTLLKLSIKEKNANMMVIM